MLQVPYLDLDPAHGAIDDANAAIRSPRQLCLAVAQSLREYHVKPAGSRANIILESPPGLLASGARVTLGTSVLRVTFACEPCSYGSRMAESPMRYFRQIERYLAIVLQPGKVWEGEYADVQQAVFAIAPVSFADRCAWALDYIPVGRVVTSIDFLNAIGASSTYARALPRWMNLAQRQHKPVHRVLTTKLGEPSWAPNALAKLVDEGLDPSQCPLVQYPLMNTLWFPHLAAPVRGTGGVQNTRDLANG
jgi:alkylated DNA nucleotide flippase Atl1